MELLIIGAGAMGGLFGALLAPHAAVSLLTTNQEHAAVMGGHGLTLVDLDGATRRVPVRVLTDPQDYGRRADLVLVCTKTRATAQAAATACSSARRFIGTRRPGAPRGGGCAATPVPSPAYTASDSEV